MGALPAKNEVLVTVKLNREQKWKYSNMYPPKRTIIKNHDAEWLGWMQDPTNLDVELENGFRDTPILLRTVIYSKKDEKWSKRDDKIYNLEKSFHSLKGWRFKEGIYKICFFVYASKNLILQQNMSLEVWKPEN